MFATQHRFDQRHLSTSARRRRCRAAVWATRLASWQALIVLSVLLLLACAMGARAAEPEDGLGAGTLYFYSDANARIEAPRLHTEVSMEVSGIVARVEVRQRFHNDSERWVEGLYAFPLPENSAVDRLRMQIGERSIVGEIQEKIQAEQLYQQAKANGQRASLVQQHRPNLFRTAVANIGPHDTIEIAIGYLQIVSQQAGRYSLRFPLTITPRYLPGSAEPAVELSSETPLAAISTVAATPEANTTLGDVQPQLTNSDAGHAGVSFDIRIDAGVSLEDIRSTYHRVAIDARDTTYRIRLADGRVAADHDFELAWTPVVHGEPAAALFREHTEQGEHVLLMLMPPHETVRFATPREVIFIIDTSGSMGGESIVQARAALLKALQSLSSADKFNIMQFNSTYDSVFSTTVPASAANLRRAGDYVSRLYATGGTEMLPALQAAMSTPRAGEYLRQIIFITDGAVGNEAQLMGVIHQQLGAARLFTVGIGSAPNGFFMRKAAQLGRGTFTYIGSTGEVDARVSELIQKIEQPALTNITLQWPPGVQAELAPAAVGDLYSGEPIVVTARLTRETRGVLQVSGVSSGPWTRQLPLGPGDSHQGIGKLWARSQIDELTDQQANGVSDADIRARVLPLALSYGLVTKYTSLVAVDHSPARPVDETLAAQRVPNAKPQGSEWPTVAYPQTATPAELHWLIGLLALVLAAAMMPWYRREQ